MGAAGILFGRFLAELRRAEINGWSLTGDSVAGWDKKGHRPC
jgi:hypothetical protein